jgi:hypothetical protein
VPVCLGHPKASGRGSQDQKLLFWGDRHGSQNRNGAVGKAEASQAPGAARAPKLCRDRRVEQETDRKQVRHGPSKPVMLQAQREIAGNELSTGIEA